MICKKLVAVVASVERSCEGGLGWEAGLLFTFIPSELHQHIYIFNTTLKKRRGWFCKVAAPVNGDLESGASTDFNRRYSSRSTLTCYSQQLTFGSKTFKTEAFGVLQERFKFLNGELNKEKHFQYTTTKIFHASPNEVHVVIL